MARAYRRAEARWDEKNSRWVIDVQRDGARKKFTSGVAGVRGRRAVEAQADAWMASKAADMRFPAAWALFEEHVRVTKGEYALKHWRWAGANYMAPVIKNKMLSDITPATWQSVLEYATRQGKARSTVRDLRGCITGFLRYARQSRWAVERPEPGDLTIPSSLPRTPEKQVLTPAQIRTLFTDDTTMKEGRSEPEWYIHAFRFAVATGLRRGELIGLQNEDISPKGVITIRRSIRSGGDITQGKTANAQRTFQLTPLAMNILKQQRAMLQQAGVRSQWVFPSARSGDHATPSWVLYSWSRYKDFHGFGNVSLHCLRHTFISLIKSDVPLALIKNTVGHSERMNTLEVYGHAIDGESERAAKLTESVFRAILK